MSEQDSGQVVRFNRLRPFILLLLAIEFLDEFIFGIREAAWPLLRADLSLTYTQIGLLLSVPGVVSSLVEPAIGILGDTWNRRALVFGGGLFYAAALGLLAASRGFALLLVSFIIMYPASGAFVSLAQASLMDTDGERHEQNMARWTFSGSLGVVLGPLALGAAVWLGAGWRGATLLTAGFALALAAAARRFTFRKQPAERNSGEEDQNKTGFLDGLRAAFRALRSREVLRWLVLLEFSDLMLDILLGYLALYMVDSAGATPLQAGLAVGVWSGVGLLGDFLLIPLLERVRGLAYLQVSVVIELVLYPLFLLIPMFWAKLALLGLIGLFNAGWYSILMGQLYRAMPGRSGTVMAVNNIAGLVAALIPLGIGLLAEEVGLPAAMWSLVLGPIVLLVGITGRMVHSS